jgi:hypothetical protein
MPCEEMKSRIEQDHEQYSPDAIILSRGAAYAPLPQRKSKYERVEFVGRRPHCSSWTAAGEGCANALIAADCSSPIPNGVRAFGSYRRVGTIRKLRWIGELSGTCVGRS